MKFASLFSGLTAAALLIFALPVGSYSSLPEDVLLSINQDSDDDLNQPLVLSDDLENLLVQSLKAIHQQRFDAALGLVDRAIEINPKFRLAHLVKGDLLLAKARPLERLGSAEAAIEESIEDLRQEAVARLTRYDAPPPVHLVPDALLELSPQQKVAILVDTGASRIYLFENRDGKPRYLSDFYVTVGKLGVDKFREGDKRTPLGVYHVTKALDPNNLPDLYGDGAYPINYPNALDRRQGRTGYGIWLHGSPSDTYSRPPQASDGCVVLTNPDIVNLGSKIQVGLTPVVITPQVNWVKLSDREIQRRELQEHIEAWRQAWELRNSNDYFAHYAIDFWSDGGTRADWFENKEAEFQSANWQQIEVKNLSILRYPAKQEMVEVRFEEIISKPDAQERRKKRQYWVKKSDQWKILYEGAG